MRIEDMKKEKADIYDNNIIRKFIVLSYETLLLFRFSFLSPGDSNVTFHVTPCGSNVTINITSQKGNTAL